MGKTLAQAPADDVTGLLERWSRGDEGALGELMPLIYREMCLLATTMLRHERRDHTLETAALVHEAYLRLTSQNRVRWRSRAHYLAIASRMMRRILSNYANRRLCLKRGGGAEHLPLEESTVQSEHRQLTEHLALDEALTALARRSAGQARIVELHYFGGLTYPEIAGVLDTSVATVKRRWRMARAWLYEYLRPSRGGHGQVAKAVVSTTVVDGTPSSPL